MNNNINMPKKIKIGFQKRSDTYTGKLAYIIYYDNKGKLRKEPSWNNWRDSKIKPIEYDNTPTEGFVLNKKVGGYRCGWDSRKTYTRVYDPRGFEFEISIENLIYILEHTSSIKGKGLEGEFVYCWSGKDLVLLPCGSSDYEEIRDFNNKRVKNRRFKESDMVIGGTYLNKDNKPSIYMGRHRSHSSYIDTLKEEVRYFFNVATPSNTGDDHYLEQNYKSLTGSILDIVDDTCVENYSELYEKMTTNDYSKYSLREPANDKMVCYSKNSLYSYFDYMYDSVFEFYDNSSGKIRRKMMLKCSNDHHGYYWGKAYGLLSKIRGIYSRGFVVFDITDSSRRDIKNRDFDISDIEKHYINFDDFFEGQSPKYLSIHDTNNNKMYDYVPYFYEPKSRGKK